MPIRLRPAGPADQGAFAGFRCATSGSWTRRIEQIVRTELADTLADPSRQLIARVADDGGEVVGVAAIEPVEEPVGAWAVRLVAVARSRQRTGIGRLLLEDALDACLDRGAARVILEAHRRNEPILRLAEQFGAAWVEDQDDPEFRVGVIVAD